MMKDLTKLLPIMLRRAAESEEVREHAVFAAWIGAVGTQLRRVSTPIKLERKTLIIAVKNPTWSAQLARMKGHLLFKLNSLLGAPIVTSLEFVVNPDMIKEIPEETPRQIEFIAPEAHAQLLQDSAKPIVNPELRNTFLRAASKCLDRRNR